MCQKPVILRKARDDRLSTYFLFVIPDGMPATFTLLNSTGYVFFPNQYRAL